MRTFSYIHTKCMHSKMPLCLQKIFCDNIFCLIFWHKACIKILHQNFFIRENISLVLLHLAYLNICAIWNVMISFNFLIKINRCLKLNVHPLEHVMNFSLISKLSFYILQFYNSSLYLLVIAKHVYILQIVWAMTLYELINASFNINLN